eukprot:scaffold72791_cov26-Tisochrysis_lutea.AAC.3
MAVGRMCGSASSRSSTVTALAASWERWPTSELLKNPAPPATPSLPAHPVRAPAHSLVASARILEMAMATARRLSATRSAATKPVVHSEMRVNVGSSS